MILICDAIPSRSLFLYWFVHRGIFKGALKAIVKNIKKGTTDKYQEMTNANEEGVVKRLSLPHNSVRNRISKENPNVTRISS